MDLIPKNLEELVRGVKDEGQPWLERPGHGGVESPERREQSKEQDHKPGLRTEDSRLQRDLLGRVPQDAALETKGVQETQLIFKDQLLHSTLTNRNQQRQQGMEQGMQGHCMNTNPGVLGWVRTAKACLELGLAGIKKCFYSYTSVCEGHGGAGAPLLRELGLLSLGQSRLGRDLINAYK